MLERCDIDVTHFMALATEPFQSFPRPPLYPLRGLIMCCPVGGFDPSCQSTVAANIACIADRRLCYEIATAICKHLTLQDANHSARCMKHMGVAVVQACWRIWTRHVSTCSASLWGTGVGVALKMRTWQQWLFSFGLVSAACTMGMTYQS